MSRVIPCAVACTALMAATAASATPLFKAGYYPRPLPSEATCIAVADFNGDSLTDAFVGVDGAILFFAGNGDMTFKPGRSLTTRSGKPEIVCADLNRDGHP